MTTSPLAAKLEFASSWTKPGQYAMTIERRLLVQIAAYLKLAELVSATSPQPAIEQKQQEEANQ